MIIVQLYISIDIINWTEKTANHHKGYFCCTIQTFSSNNNELMDKEFCYPLILIFSRKDYIKFLTSMSILGWKENKCIFWICSSLNFAQVVMQRQGFFLEFFWKWVIQRKCFHLVGILAGRQKPCTQVLPDYVVHTAWVYSRDSLIFRMARALWIPWAYSWMPEPLSREV